MLAKRKSKIHGFGLFATRRINKNTRILQYTGEKVNREECLRREEVHEKNGHIWTFELNNYWFIDAAVGGGPAKFVNHSNTPNLWIEIEKGEIWYRAARTIKEGEELTVDYGTEIPGVTTPSKN